ncbi:MAG: hypothetical protein RMJ98_02495 [Myxococcales bacterium]|nr:hypothetical protein [Polyangiaceae bacterium]MDW8248158.1 hypothetical protein [Myxococcales bacterium]
MSVYPNASRPTGWLPNKMREPARAKDKASRYAPHAESYKPKPDEKTTPQGAV